MKEKKARKKKESILPRRILYMYSKTDVKEVHPSAALLPSHRKKEDFAHG